MPLRAANGASVSRSCGSAPCLMRPMMSRRTGRGVSATGCRPWLVYPPRCSSCTPCPSFASPTAASPSGPILPASRPRSKRDATAGQETGQPLATLRSLRIAPTASERGGVLADAAHVARARGYWRRSTIFHPGRPPCRFAAALTACRRARWRCSDGRPRFRRTWVNPRSLWGARTYRGPGTDRVCSTCAHSSKN